MTVWWFEANGQQIKYPAMDLDGAVPRVGDQVELGANGPVRTVVAVRWRPWMKRVDVYFGP